MFETAVVRAQAESPQKKAGLFTASIVIHAAVILGSVASVDFPHTSPDEHGQAPLLISVQIPPPLGTPEGNGRPVAPKPVPAGKPVVVTPSNETTAPAIVPESVTPFEGEPSTSSGEAEEPGTGDDPGTGPLGQPWGVEGSPGDPNAPPFGEGGTGTVEERIYQPHEVKAPVLAYKVEPRYPQSLIRTGREATVVVRCIIDRDGRVRDVELIKADLPPFNAEVLRAVSQWRFTPGSVQGTAVNSYLNLTVTFRVTR